MKIENRIEEEDEHSKKIEILNQNSNSDFLGLDPWIHWVFSFNDHHQWKSNKIRARKEKNKIEERKKNEEHLREKEIKEFDPKTYTTRF